INTTLVEAVSDNNYPYIGDVTIERADLGFPVKLSYDESLDTSKATVRLHHLQQAQPLRNMIPFM
ncbi:hypothetical protein NQ358_24695, partial [Escherichia coli]|nr:hypothetical protein [Escherichia coli]